MPTHDLLDKPWKFYIFNFYNSQFNYYNIKIMLFEKLSEVFIRSCVGNLTVTHIGGGP
jgi:hypothetical protein